MTSADRWLLPEGIDELLPENALRLEQQRRRLLDLYESWGYELVMPPFVEFLESLLTGTSHDLDLKTFKLTDQSSGRMMGVRADMTPQVARIDAHRLKRTVPSRLCYLGTVLHTLSDGFGGSRSPLQVGAELYGHAGYHSDVEVLALMLETLSNSGVSDVHLDLGHVAIFRQLAISAGLSAEQELELFEVLQRKAGHELEALLSAYQIADPATAQIRALLKLNGGPETLDQAELALSKAGKPVLEALNTLREIATAVSAMNPDLPIHFDLAELRGYQYHTGVVFAAYVPGHGQAVAKGGRYDDIGKVFGASRPATGFSADLKTLLSISDEPARVRSGIYAPADSDVSLQVAIVELRAAGERVIRALPGVKCNAVDMGCDRVLKLENSTWEVHSAHN